MSNLDLDPSILPVERALIGAVVYEGGRIIPPLLPAEFSSDRNRQIWQAMVDLAEGIDMATLYRELAVVGQIDAVGGPAYLAQCLEDGALVVPALMPRYAAMIRDAARTRMLRQLGRDLAEQGFDEPEIERRLAEVPGALIPLEDHTPSEVWRAHEASLARSDAVQVRTGLGALDHILGAFMPGELAVVAGRTSHGKSAFMLHVALTAAASGVPVTFLSLEDPRAILVSRAVSRQSDIPYMRLVRGGIGEEERREVDRGLRWLDALPVTWLSLDTLRSLDEETVCGAVAVARTPVVLVDHLQKIATSGESRAYGLERVMNRLHAAALRDHRIILVAAQLNREMDAEKRPPRLSDLRDSGAIEIMARKVLLLYWPCRHDPAKSAHDYLIYVAKNATGSTGQAAIRFSAATGSFWDSQ